MSIRIGLYDLFAYTIPGVFYLLIAAYTASAFGLLQLNWSTINNLSLVALTVIIGAGYVVGIMLDRVAFPYYRMFTARGSSARVARKFESEHPAMEQEFTRADWRILLHHAQSTLPDHAEAIEHLNVMSIMMRNISLGFATLVVIHTLYFLTVSAYYWNLLLALICVALAVLAFRASVHRRGLFFETLYAAIAASYSSPEQWIKGTPKSTITPRQDSTDEK